MTTLTTYLSGMRTSITPVRALRAERLWEIDTLRGIAIIMMVVYHLLWDLASLGGYDIALRTGFWSYWQIVTASLFTTLVGLSMTLSYHAARPREHRAQVVGHGRVDDAVAAGLFVGRVEPGREAHRHRGRRHRHRCPAGHSRRLAGARVDRHHITAGQPGGDGHQALGGEAAQQDGATGNGQGPHTSFHGPSTCWCAHRASPV